MHMLHERSRARYRTSRHFLSVCAALRAPPEWVLDAVHVYNLIFRLALLVLGTAMYASEGFAGSPGITLAEYDYTAWDDVPDSAWGADAGELPGPSAVLSPGSGLLAVLWFTLAATLFVGDIERMASKVFGVRDSRIDYVWHGIMGLASPQLFLLLAVQLGTHDLVSLAFALILTCVSIVVSQVAESMCKLVNLEEGTSPKGFTSVALPVLRWCYDICMAVLTFVVTLPVLRNSAAEHPGVSTLRGALCVCLVMYSVSLVAIQHAHHRFLRRVQKTWPCREKREYESSGARDAAPPRFLEARSTTGVRDFFRKLAAPRPDRGADLYENLYGTRVFTEYSPRARRPPASPSHSFKWQSAPDESDDTFNRLYGCRVNGGSASNNYALTAAVGTITAPPAYRMTSDLQYVPCAGSRGRDKLIPRSHGFTEVDTHEEDARCARMRVAHLVEWRRHYVLNILVNTLLLTSLVQMDRVSVDMVTHMAAWMH